MHHATAVPGDEHGGDGYGIFYGAAEELAVVALLFIHILEHVPRQDDGDVLLGGNDIEQDAGEDGGGYQTDAAPDEFQKIVGDAGEHTGGLHGSPEAHGAHGEPDGVHHAVHAVGGDQSVEEFMAGAEVGIAIEHDEQAFEEVASFGYLRQQMGLEEEGAKAGYEDTDG